MNSKIRTELYFPSTSEVILLYVQITVFKNLFRFSKICWLVGTITAIVVHHAW